MTLKRAKVHMLPTKSKITHRIEQGDLYLDKGILYINPQTNYNRDEKLCNPQHLYITSDEEIKEGDWMFESYFSIGTGKKGSIRQFPGFGSNFPHHNLGMYNKIIATTDTSIGITDHKISPVPNFIDLPQPSNDFINKYIEKYNKDEQIVDVLVEYERKNNTGLYGIELEFWYESKIDKNYCITIKPVKDNWNSEEVKILINEFHKDFCEGTGTDDIKDEWIEKNL